MQDQPNPSEVIGAVAAFLRNVVTAQTTGATSSRPGSPPTRWK